MRGEAGGRHRHGGRLAHHSHGQAPGNNYVCICMSILPPLREKVGKLCKYLPSPRLTFADKIDSKLPESERGEAWRGGVMGQLGLLLEFLYFDMNAVMMSTQSA